jgi:hypothetical protein
MDIPKKPYEIVGKRSDVRVPSRVTIVLVGERFTLVYRKVVQVKKIRLKVGGDFRFLGPIISIRIRSIITANPIFY